MRWIIERPVLSGMLFASILILGIYSIRNTPVELVPDEKLPSLTVTAFWYGAFPEMLLERVALPLEEVLGAIKGVEKLKSLCEEGRMRLTLEFSRGTNMQMAYLRVKENINRLRKKLPPQAARSIRVVPFVPKGFERKPLLSVAVFSRLPLQSIRNIVEREFLPPIKGIEGVSRVELWGGAPPEVKILLKREKLLAYGISVSDVYSAISREFFNLPSIEVQRKGSYVLLTLSSFPRGIEEIERVSIDGGGGRKIPLREVGRVFLSSGRIREEKRYQGMPLVVLDIYKERGASTLHLASLLKRKIGEIERKVPSVSTKIIEDESRELKTRLLKLVKLSLLIILIIFAILLLVLKDLRPSLLVISSVFFSVFASFTLIYLLKIPVNLLTLSGFALGFGMFVDNAVVVFENILRLREGGMERVEASAEGARGVFLPVVASTLTTIIVFFSFAYFQGRLRLYYLPLAYTVSIAMVCSVLVAFTLIPSMAARMNFRIRRRKDKGEGGFLNFSLRYPLFVLLPLSMVFFLSARLFYRNVNFGRFFSWYQKQRIYVWIELPPGASFQDTKKTILKFEKTVLSQPYPKEVKTQISGNYAYMEVKFPKEVEFSARPYILKQKLIQLATNFAGIGVGVWGFDPQGYSYSPHMGSFLPYSVVIKGYDFWKLKGIARRLIETLLMNSRIEEAKVLYQRRFFWGGERKYYSFRLKFPALRKYHIDPKELLFQISPFISSRSHLSRIRIGKREIDLEVDLFRREEEMEELLKREFLSRDRRPFRLKDVVEVREEKFKGGIERENQQYVATVQWDYLGSFKRGRELEEAVYRNLSLPAGFTKSRQLPWWRMRKGEMEQIKSALVISLLLIFIVLAILYESLLQPLVAMLTVPLGLIGVFLAFYVSDFPFDSTAYIGLILLFGIAVNNAIILIDHSNSYLRRGASPLEAALRGARERLRPIFMTSATTVLGMLPLVLFHRAGQSDIWTTLALCTVGGLTTSALLVPVVIPIFYHLSFRIRDAL